MQNKLPLFDGNFEQVPASGQGLVYEQVPVTNRTNRIQNQTTIVEKIRQYLQIHCG